MRQKYLYAVIYFFGMTFQLIAQQPNTTNKKSKKQNADKVSLSLQNYYTECKNCQDENVLIYDFNCKHFFYPKDNEFLLLKNLKDYKLSYHQPFKIKIVNINRYNYDIDLNADDINFGSEQPTLFKQLFAGEGSFVNDLITKLGQLAPFVSEEKETILEKFRDILTRFIEKYNDLVNKQLDAYNYCPKDGICCDSAKLLKFSDLANDFINLKLTFQSFSKQLNEDIANSEKQVQSSTENLENCKKQLAELNEKLKKVKKGSKEESDLLAKIAKLDCESLNTKLKNDKKDKDLLEFVKSDMEKLWAVSSNINYEDLTKLVLFNNNFLNDHFSYTSPAIYPSGSRLSIGLRISPADSSLIKKWNIMPLYNDSIGIELIVKGKWWVSFSSGPFVGFGSALKDETYSWQPQPDSIGLISDSSRYKLISTGHSSQPLGIAALANIGTRFSYNFGMGFSTGVGVSIINKIKPAYLFGVSAFFGEKQQINLTFGGILMPVEKLKSELYSDHLYTKKPAEIEYRNKLASGLFLAASYTFYSFDRSRNSASRSKK